MSVGLIEAARRSRANANELRSGFVKATPNEERDVRVMAATRDPSSIRALISAFPHFFAGLPRSDCGDRPGGRSLKTFEGSPHRSRASRCWFGVTFFRMNCQLACFSGHGDTEFIKAALRTRRDVTCQIPNESTEL